MVSFWLGSKHYSRKYSQLCSICLKLLKEQLNLLMDSYILNSNPFEPTDSNTEEVNSEENLFGQNDDEVEFFN